MSILKNEKSKRMLISLSQLLIGCLIYSLSISVFYTPAKLLGGGVTGFAQILNFSLGLPVSTMVVLINIPLFVLSLIFLDRYFTITSLFGMLLLSVCLHLTSGLQLTFTSPLTSVALGGVVNGIGLGLVYRSEASMGGSDIICKIIQRYYSGNMAYTGMAINVTIVMISAWIYGLDQAVLTICSMYISSQVNTYLIDGIDHRRAVSIITDDPEKMSAAILRDLHRGATELEAYGAYTHKEKRMLYCVITRHELVKLKHLIHETDPNAFYTITPLTGVYGNGHGFRSVRNDIH